MHVSWRSTRATGQGGEDVRQVAVIDLGSNSWRLVVYMFEPGDWWKLTDEIFETVRIGAGLAETGRLSEAGMGRGLETLAVFEHFCAAHGIGPDAVHAVATSAIRDATNGEMFLKAARAASGLNIEVISDEDEARFGYVAAINSSTMTDGIVLETGGGSIQVIEVADRRTVSLHSYPLGAVRVTEQFLPGSGPAKKRDLQRVRAHVRDVLADEAGLAGAGNRIVGMGGAVRNLAAAAQRMADQPDIGVQGFVITREMLAELVQTLAALSVDERGDVPGIKVGRADIILASALVIETVVELGGSPESRSPRPAFATACSSPASCLPTLRSRCSRTSASPACATSRSSTNRTCAMSSTSRCCRCRCSTRCRAPACSSPSPASGSCCGRPRCSTTSG